MTPQKKEGTIKKRSERERERARERWDDVLAGGKGFVKKISCRTNNMIQHLSLFSKVYTLSAFYIFTPSSYR